MASAVSNLLIYQGSDFITDFTIENDNGTLFALTGYTVACKINLGANPLERRVPIE